MKALLTGATSGIGQALARLLASKGYSLILTGRNTMPLKQLADRLGAESVAADLADRGERQALIELIRQQVPELVINAAGYALYGEMLTRSVEEELTLLEVNASAPIQLTLAAAHALIAAQKKGVILNVSSVAGEFYSPGMGLYGPAKACLTNFSRTLNTELAPRGVHILVSCPGMVETEFANRAAGKPVRQKGVVMTPEYSAQQIWKQIEKGQEKRIFNWFYRLSVLLVPGWLAKQMIWRSIKERL